MMRWPTMPVVIASPRVHVAWMRDVLTERRSRQEAADGGLSPLPGGKNPAGSDPARWV